MDDVVRDIANAVLYEGHMLYPYRPSSLKNRQRWTFGGVYPAAYAAATGDRARVGFEALVEGERPVVEVEVRYLLGTEERAVGVGETERPPGLVESRLERLRPDAHRLAVSIENRSAWSGCDRNEAMQHTFGSAHALAHVTGGAFVSPRETTEPLTEDGLWPVLVGEPGDRSTLLASPIVLDDYPRVAPESPGDFFDGCEIDQLLVLGVLALSDAEREEARAADPRVRALLDRTEAMSPEELMRLHGTWRAP